MNSPTDSLSLHGIFPPLVTSLTRRGDELDIDVEGLARLLEHVIAGRVAGVFALGTTGETASLSSHVRHRMVEETCRIVAGRVPVLADHPNVIGIKDSSRDWDFFCTLVDAFAGRDDFSLLVGPEIFLARAVQAGAVGGICGGANMHLALYVELHKAAAANNSQRVAELQSVVERIGETIYSVSKRNARLIQGIKAALQCLGICDSAMAPPLVPLGEEDREKVAGYLGELGITALQT